MKKYFVIAIAAVAALASCTKTTVETPDLAISFQPANYVGSTKVIDGAIFPTTETFGVNAWYTPATGDANQVFMNNETVSHTTADTWEPSAVYYWPKTGTVDFQSYYPAGTPWFSIGTNGTTLTASISSALAGTEDYMYADKAVGLNQNVNEVAQSAGTNFTGVPTLFHHALARVAVNVKASKVQDKETAPDVKWTITVDEAKFVKVNTTGTLSMNLAATTTTDHTKAWTLPTNSVWTATTPADVAASATLPLELSKDNKELRSAYTVIPQALGTEATSQALYLKVTIKAYNKAGGLSDATNLFSTETITKTIILNPNSSEADKMEAGAPAAWAMNTITTYNITVNPADNKITFDPAVVDWDKTATGNYTVNQ